MYIKIFLFTDEQNWMAVGFKTPQLANLQYKSMEIYIQNSFFLPLCVNDQGRSCKKD